MNFQPFLKTVQSVHVHNILHTLYNMCFYRLKEFLRIILIILLFILFIYNIFEMIHYTLSHFISCRL